MLEMSVHTNMALDIAKHFPYVYKHSPTVRLYHYARWIWLDKHVGLTRYKASWPDENPENLLIIRFKRLEDCVMYALAWG